MMVRMCTVMIAIGCWTAAARTIVIAVSVIIVSVVVVVVFVVIKFIITASHAFCT